MMPIRSDGFRKWTKCPSPELCSDAQTARLKPDGLSWLAAELAVEWQIEPSPCPSFGRISTCFASSIPQIAPALKLPEQLSNPSELLRRGAVV